MDDAATTSFKASSALGSAMLTEEQFQEAQERARLRLHRESEKLRASMAAIRQDVRDVDRLIGQRLSD